VHKVGHTREVGAVDEHMVSFENVGSQRGMLVILGALLHEGVRHAQRKQGFTKVKFGLHIKEQRNTTKKA
jgi:hypothetical protein